MRPNGICVDHVPSGIITFLRIYQTRVDEDSHEDLQRSLVMEFGERAISQEPNYFGRLPEVSTNPFRAESAFVL